MTPKKKKILDSAARLFSKKGFVATSVDEIVEDAGVAKGTLFYHFPTKADLLRELIDSLSTEMLELVESELDFEKPGLVLLEDLVRVSISYSEKNEDRLLTLMRDTPSVLMLGGEGSSELPQITKATNSVNSLYSKVFAVGAADGTLDVACPDKSAGLLHLMIFGYIKMRFIRACDIGCSIDDFVGLVRKAFSK